MAENITRETDASVEDFLAKVEHPGRRADGFVLVELLRRVTGVEPRMWGTSIIGFGKYRYRYDSGREGEMLRVGFSPRKANLPHLRRLRGRPRYDALMWPRRQAAPG